MLGLAQSRFHSLDSCGLLSVLRLEWMKGHTATPGIPKDY